MSLLRIISNYGQGFLSHFIQVLYVLYGPEIRLSSGHG